MLIREIKESDAEEYVKLCTTIDAESDFLLFEEGERTTTIEQQIERIKALESKNNSTIFVAEIDNKLVGYLIANGGQAKRNRHSVYIVIGIMADYTGHGIGTKLFESLESWALSKGIVRLELGLMAQNIPAFLLYKKMDFELEGVKQNVFNLNGNYINEYMMAKLLN